MVRKAVLLVAFTVLIYTSCKEPDFLDNYDRQALFAPPTQEELDAVKTDWQSRALLPDGYAVEQETEVNPNGTILKIVSFKVNGYKEYGALLIPESDQSMPVHMYLSGFAIDNTEAVINLVQQEGSGDQFIFAVPAFRGQSLSITINGVEYNSPVSEGIHCEAFDGAADDAIAFLNIIQSTEEKANTERVSMRGGSRGGGVALLVAGRDKRVKLAIDIAGPTNMLDLTAINENDLTYQCQFLDDLVNGSASISDVRQKMIASSPVFFAADLPKTQLHLAANDWIVPVSQGEQLKQRMDELGRTDIFELFIYEGREHSNIANDNQEMNTRINAFLEQL